MYCPKCGANQSDELRFCNLCGANLSAVRQVVAAGEKSDSDRTWAADMLLPREKGAKLKSEEERGLNLEEKRQNEIKGGIITSCVGVGLMIFLYVFMQGIIKGAGIPENVAEILSRVWVAGVLPFFVGLGLLINGLFVSQRLVKAAGLESPAGPDALQGDAAQPALRPADTTEFIQPDFSVTENTTKHLSSSSQGQ